MSHARDRYVKRTRENHRGNPHLEPRYYLDYLPYNFQKGMMDIIIPYTWCSTLNHQFVEIAHLVSFESFSLGKRSISSVCRTYLIDAMFFFLFSENCKGDNPNNNEAPNGDSLCGFLAGD
jgi:hypothetical protein